MKRQFPEYIPLKQQYLDIVANAVDTANETARSLFRRSSPKERAMVTRAIDEGSVATLPPRLKAAAIETKKIFAEMAEVDTKAGVLDNVLSDYITHLYNLGSMLPGPPHSGV